MVTAAFLAGCAKAAVTLNQIEDFSGIHGWSGGIVNPNPPVIAPDAGPLGSGDNALRVTSSGGNGPGGRLIAFNRAQWAGDYSAAGVLSVTADLQNLSTVALSMRLAFNGPGGWFVTDASPVAAFSGWTNHVFDVRPGALSSAGGSNSATTLAAVSEMRILHSVTVDFHGAQVSRAFMVDNIRAIPEPSTGWGLALAAIALLFRKR
jgi:hypothetical protein